MEHFIAVFKLDLTEETRTQLQEETIASSCLILATPMKICTIIQLDKIMKHLAKATVCGYHNGTHSYV